MRWSAVTPCCPPLRNPMRTSASTCKSSSHPRPSGSMISAAQKPLTLGEEFHEAELSPRNMARNHVRTSRSTCFYAGPNYAHGASFELIYNGFFNGEDALN